MIIYTVFLYDKTDCNLLKHGLQCQLLLPHGNILIRN